MSHQFGSVPSLDSSAAQDELNAFCEQHRVVLVEKHFVQAGQTPQHASDVLHATLAHTQSVHRRRAVWRRLGAYSAAP